MKNHISVAVGTIVLAFAGVISAQTPATLTDFGTTAPVPGLADISQLSIVGEVDKPDGLNYYTDNQTDHGAGEPGQTFTTGSSPGGYTLKSLTVRTGGGTASGLATPKGYLLHIYSVAGGTATVIASYSATNFVYTDGDWLRWSGLSVSLAINSTYAYSCGKAAAGGSWGELATAGGNPYAGGEVDLIPTSGGAITFGGSHGFDGAFDVGLTGDPFVGPPAASPTNTLYSGATVTFSAAVSGTAPFQYQWQTNGANLGGATNTTLVLTNLTIANDAFYDVVVTNVFGSVKSSSNHVQVLPPSAPFFVTPANSQTQFTGGQVLFAATISGSPATLIQWRRNGTNLNDGGNLFGSQTLSLTITNLVLTNAATYALVVSNSLGAATNTVTLTVLTTSLASVTNLSALNIQPTIATLNGQVLSTGGQTPVVILYFGPVDGGNNAANWANSSFLGQQAGFFSTTVAGLTPNTTYYFAASATNSSGIVWATPSGTFATPSAPPPVSMLTYHNDNTRAGANTNELLLTPANVNVSNFGRLFSYVVDGHVYAQPLVMTNVSIPGKGVHNVVFVGTEHDTFYAFDADSNTGPNGGLLWQTNLGISAVTPNSDFGNRYGPYHDLNPEMGITGTPVIDPVSGTLYLDAFTHEGASYFHRIHALDITSGKERSFSPVLVTASVPGLGVGSSGGILPFDQKQDFNRCAMTLTGGILFATYTGYADTDPYHGWILGYNPANLQQLTNYIFNTSPNSTIAAWGANAGECGIWMGGNGLCVDANTNLYFEVGNGPFNANTNGTEYGDSFLKLSTSNKLAAADYFTPFNQASLASADADLGSGGPLLLPDSVGSAAHPHLIVGCGKEGKIYLVDRDNMGHYNAANDNQVVQSIGGAVGGTWSSPAYFNNFIYYLGNGDVLKAFKITNGVIVTAPASQSTTSYGFPGATPSVSAEGTNNGIVWAIQADAFGSGGPAILHAYNATNVAQELYNSSQNLARDNPGGAVKMTVPTIVNGKVYVGAKFALSVFGNSVFLAVPTITPNGGIFTNSVTVTLADATPGVNIYYTLNGTTPTTNSLPYTGPFVLTNSVSVQTIATKPGVLDSAVAAAGFVNSSAIGNGIGLTGSYYSNHTSISPFTGSPTLVRTDAMVNFDWNSTGPDPSVGQTTFTARWTGSVQPQFNETYTFYATADDGVRLWVNGRLLIDAWVNQAPTTYSASIPLKAQQLYNLQMDYFQGNGGAVAQLAWSSPSTPQTIIPQSQLYPYTNPPPGVVLTSPAANSSYTASASVTLNAAAAAQNNTLDNVAFYANSVFLGSVSNNPYIITAAGLAAGSYALTAVATDGSGLMSTSAPVNIIVSSGSGLPYGINTRATVPAFFNLPQTFNGALPPLLSQAGVFANTPNMVPANGLIPYSPNTPLWSDGAAKTRWMALPYNGGLDTPDQQIGFSTNGEWAFPAGTVFVKHFALATDETNTNVPLRRLETRLLVRDPNGAVYGVTYKWRPDNSEADLLSGSLSESILITNALGIRTQTWYYPSPSDCLACHTPAANYVLGLKTRQLNGNFSYPSSGVTDNQLRTFNRLGLFNPGIDEAQIPGYSQMVSLTNFTASLTNRFRSYLDANCAQCHRPGGSGPSFDARYDTPLASQNIVNGNVLGNLGYDNAHVVTPRDIWRSILYQRANSLDPLIKMPPLARNLVDSNAMAVVAAWINGLPGTPALSPPTLNPVGGTFNGPVNITVLSPDTNAAIYYTLNNSLPTTNSLVYTGPIVLTNSATVNANVFEAGFNNSVAASGVFTILPPIFFTASAFSNGVFQLQLSATPNQTYVLQASTNLAQWVSVSTNTASSTPLNLTDPNATDFSQRFYRVLQQP